ncbi:tyrosine-type recombinase/integrase [Sphingomonas crocodyli]|uniref:Tyr recombinase domain-containing protein n=1 Tax=Sphingomonas crocodyli TaxID=1979270 RepID=A0A437M6Z6_9SPHN|nr:tyrosine-type recombinase/integrase [Sphingomonas crocodyli]RVT93429.1 hypothetical protein EOD43_06010 [Sphingomonas crocodyli]
MATLKAHRQRWQAKVRIPIEHRAAYDGREFLYRHLATSDRRVAKVEADAWEATLRLEWQAKVGGLDDKPKGLRQVYNDLRRRAAAGEFRMEIRDEDPVIAGIDYELEKLGDIVGERDYTPTEAARNMALNDARRELHGQRVKKRPELEPTFSEVCDDFMALWRSQRHLKETNTEQQKLATFKLFEGFWGDKPLRGVRQPDASAFHDALRRTDPNWARSPSAKEMTWTMIQREYGNQTKGGLSDATMNRHMATLKGLWDWAARRGHCEGFNPFEGFHRKLRAGVNVDGYVAWETDELNHLFAQPPKRADLRELIVVGMFTGMRLDEIASLKWDQIRTDEGVTYFQVEDAKTPAGNRQVPLHPSLGWLKARKDDAKEERVWPTFNPEGPGKKAGADAGKEFSRFKSARGFKDRRKAFHSFRKNVTRMMERGGVRENEWAQVFGHEKGFTYGRYNADGITLQQKADIIALIAYPAVSIPLVTESPGLGEGHQ